MLKIDTTTDESDEIVSAHRAHELLSVLQNAGGSCRTAELAALLNVSEETVRRNVKKLAKRGMVIKVHGGVLLANNNAEPAFGKRLEENRAAKQQMALAVVDLIEDGASMFINSSSSTAFVATALRVRKNLFVVTNAIKVAETLSAHNQNRVFFAGGELRESDGGSYSAQAVEFLRGFTPDFAILAASAVSADKGFMLTDLAEAECDRVFIQNASTSIIVADQTKFGRNAPITLCPMDPIATVVTDARPPEDFRIAAQKNNLKIIVAPAAQTTPRNAK